MTRKDERRSSAPVAILKLSVRESVDVPFRAVDQEIKISPRDDFCFGRSLSCGYQCEDPTISNKHLHIHCIVYEDDEASGIPPLVYVEDLSTNGTYVTRAGRTDEERLTRGQDGTILLCHGDRLRVGPHMSFLFISNPLLLPKEVGGLLSELQRREIQLFRDRFEITNRVLGIGGYGAVFAAIHKKSHRQLACKVIDVNISLPTTSPETGQPLEDVTNTSRKLFDTGQNMKKRRSLEDQNRSIRDDPQFREFEVLKDLDHPNIIRLEKVFWSVNTFYIFQELVTGGDLFSYIESKHKGGRLPDIEAAVVLRQILKAVEYLHDRDIVHRDLKPDNILVTSTIEGARIVVTDFGNARYLPPEDTTEIHELPLKKRRMFTMAGTLEYVAPEVHEMNPLVPKSEGYSKAVDMWSVGAITAALLTGDVIFVNRIDPRFKNDAQLMLNLAAKCDLSVLDEPYSVWRTIGKRPKNLIKNLLVLDESKRFTATQCLAHEWFTNKHYVDELDAVYQRSIKGWTPRRKIFRLIEALDISRLATERTENHGNEGLNSRYFPQESLITSHQSSNTWFKPSRKLLAVSLPKIDEETPMELQESAASASELQMTPYLVAEDEAIPESVDMGQSMNQLALDTSEASTDSLMDDDLAKAGDKSFDFDEYYEMAVECSEQNFSAPIDTESSLVDRKRRSSSKITKESVERYDDLKFIGHDGTKRARVAYQS